MKLHRFYLRDWLDPLIFNSKFFPGANRFTHSRPINTAIDVVISSKRL